jgi:hypothetical protein
MGRNFFRPVFTVSARLVLSFVCLTAGAVWGSTCDGIGPDSPDQFVDNLVFGWQAGMCESYITQAALVSLLAGIYVNSFKHSIPAWHAAFFVPVMATIQYFVVKGFNA